MSVRMMALVWELDLPKPEKFLALALADFADDDGGNIYPSVARLAWKTSDSTRNVRRLLRRLEESGLLVIVQRGGGRFGFTGRGITTLYRLDPTKADILSPFTSPRPLSVVHPLSDEEAG